MGASVKISSPSFQARTREMASTTDRTRKVGRRSQLWGKSSGVHGHNCCFWQGHPQRMLSWRRLGNRLDLRRSEAKDADPSEYSQVCWLTPWERKTLTDWATGAKEQRGQGQNCFKTQIWKNESFKQKGSRQQYQRLQRALGWYKHWLWQLGDHQQVFKKAFWIKDQGDRMSGTQKN